MKQHYVLAMIVGILLLLWLGSELFKAMKAPKEEGFQSSAVTLNLCPVWAPQIQTAKGNTDCCEGDLVDGKCSSRTFCTLSPAHDGVPLCIDAWRKYFADKSAQCPSTMRNYYEDVRNKDKPKGCSVSQPVLDGSQPQNQSVPKCRIYNTERENRELADSCYIEKQRLQVKCPSFPGYSNTIEKVMVKEGGVDKFGSFVCAYSNPIGQRNSCNEEKSLLALWDRQNPNWRQDSNRYKQLEQISCRTFLERERQKELERQRIEAARRRAEEERRKREALQRQFTSFKGFFARFKRQAEEAAARARRAAEEQRRAAQRRAAELSRRLRGCR